MGVKETPPRVVKEIMGVREEGECGNLPDAEVSDTVASDHGHMGGGGAGGREGKTLRNKIYLKTGHQSSIGLHVYHLGYGTNVLLFRRISLGVGGLCFVLSIIIIVRFH